MDRIPAFSGWALRHFEARTIREAVLPLILKSPFCVPTDQNKRDVEDTVNEVVRHCRIGKITMKV